jgi:uncharacterized membrane protein
MVQYIGIALMALGGILSYLGQNRRKKSSPNAALLLNIGNITLAIGSVIVLLAFFVFR